MAVDSYGYIQPTPEELYTLVMRIRHIADNGGFVVLRGNKTDSWKSELLNYLSDTVVFQHLQCLHPFQYFACTSNSGAGVFAFRVSFYKDNIYLKVNINTCEVISFHYGENPYGPAGYPTVSHGREIGPFTSVQIIAEQDIHGYSAIFAVGSNTIRRPVDVTFQGSRIAYITNADYMELLDTMAHSYQKTLVRTIENFIKEEQRALGKSLKAPVDDYGILSYSDNPLQLISLLHDIWNSHGDAAWFRDAAVDLIYKQPPEDIERFLNILHFSEKTNFPPKPSVFEAPGNEELSISGLPISDSQPLRTPGFADLVKMTPEEKERFKHNR